MKYFPVALCLVALFFMSVIPVVMVSAAPVCGNDICEVGEAGKTVCPACRYSNPPCLAPCTLERGSCPSDCDATECRVDSDCPIGICPSGKTYKQYSCLNNECYAINYFADPCSVPGDGSFCKGKNIQTCCSQWAADNNIPVIKCLGSWHLVNNKCTYQCGDYDDDDCENGCSLNNACYSLGTRRNGMYCSIDDDFVDQLSTGEYCSASYECESNYCRDNTCRKRFFWWWRLEG
jgi:hypothetical protein